MAFPYPTLLKDGKAAADQQLALFEAQKKALEQELAKAQRTGVKQ